MLDHLAMDAQKLVFTQVPAITKFLPLQVAHGEDYEGNLFAERFLYSRRRIGVVQHLLEIAITAFEFDFQFSCDCRQ